MCLCLDVCLYMQMLIVHNIQIEIFANELVQVAALRKELMLIKSQRENELKSNLLTYIQALPDMELQRLTSDMSPEVLQAIQLLVSAILVKMGK
ncbi:DUF760 domain-containing protein [archaeon]|nr:MAG: DUF760 domain-containing protein [archaeon]